MDCYLGMFWIVILVCASVAQARLFVSSHPTIPFLEDALVACEQGFLQAAPWPPNVPIPDSFELKDFYGNPMNEWVWKTNLCRQGSALAIHPDGTASTRSCQEEHHVICFITTEDRHLLQNMEDKIDWTPYLAWLLFFFLCAKLPDWAYYWVISVLVVRYILPLYLYSLGYQSYDI